MSSWVRQTCLLSMVALFFLKATAQNQEVLRSEGNRQHFIDLRKDLPAGFSLDIFADCSFLNDSSGTWSFDDVRERTNEFKPFSRAWLTDWSRAANNVPSTWVRLLIHSNAERRLLLSITRPEIEYYLRKDDQDWTTGRIGTHLDNQREYLRLNASPVIPLDFRNHRKIEIIAKVSPARFVYTGHHQLHANNFHLLDQDGIYESQLLILRTWLPIIFIIFSVGIYHFVLFFYNREQSFLHLGLFAFSTVALILYNSDLAINWWVAKNPGTLLDLGFPIAYGSTVFAFPFTIHYLRLYDRQNLWRRLLQISIFMSISVPVACIALWVYSPVTFADSQPVLGILYFVIHLYNLPLMVLVGMVAWYHGNANAKYYTMGMGTWQILNTIAILNVMSNGVDIKVPTEYAAPIGLLLFSFGLARQFKELQDQRNEAEKLQEIAERDRIIEKNEADRLKELNEVTSKLYTNITHEFRTPLTVISGITQQIKGHQTEKRLIQRSANNLLDLVNQLLDLNQLEAGNLKPQLKHIDIVPLMKYLAETLEQLCLERKQIFAIEILDEAIWMDTDPAFLERILANLVHNATKFTPRDGRIILRVFRHLDCCHLEVIDSGKGIPQEHHPSVFDRFYQVSDKNDPSVAGSGIGLSLVKELVQMLNGQIGLDSKIGKGSTFSLEFPINASIAAEDWQGSHDVTSPHDFDLLDQGVPDHGTEILIIEDHQDVRLYLKRLLQSRYKVREALDGKQGLGIALKHIPDLIISDIMMPELDGYTLCHTLKTDAKTSHIPVILLTAKSTQHDRLTGLEEGADAYLVKPFDERELFIRTEKLLEVREQLRLHYQKFCELPSDKVVENLFLRKVQQIMEQNFISDDFQSEHLAKALHLSRTQLFRKLKSLTGKSFTELYRQLKINRARQLLRKTDQSVSEISYQLGFRDPSYFSKVFKEEMGCTPGEFRKG